MLVGNNTGLTLTTGVQNSAFGTEALKSITTGNYNAAIGGSAFKFGLLTTNNSSALGNGAGCLAIAGNLITASPYQNWVGNNDTFLGAFTTPWGNTTQVNASTAAGSNVLYFSSVPSWIQVGQFVDDYSAAGVIPAGTYVTAITSTTVTLSANVTGAGASSSDFITFWGYATSLAASAATASGSTLMFSNVPLNIVVGMTVQDTTTSGVIPANTTVTAVSSTAVTLSNSVTGAGVSDGDTIVFSQGQFDYMTVIGANAYGFRPNTIFMGRPQDSVVISPASPAMTSLAGLTIGAGNYARAAINLPVNGPSGQNPAIAGDLWFDNGHLYFYNGTLTGQADGVVTFLSSGGDSNLFVGPSAGNATMGGTTGQGTNNVLISPGACGQGLTTGAYNTAVGAAAGAGFTTANYNTLLGCATGQAISSGYQNSAFGAYAGTAISTGYGNTCFGFNTGSSITTGTANTVIGLSAGATLVSNSGCTIIGSGAGPSVTGGNNVLIGFGAGGATLTSGTNNTFIGTSIAPASNVSNTLILGAGGNAIVVGDSTTVRPQYPLKLPSYTVATLPSASTAGAGTQAWVSDATSPTRGQTLSGGGSTPCMAVSNGTNWVAGIGASINNSCWSGTALAIGNGGTGQTSANAAFNALSPLTTAGDLLYGGASGAGNRLGIGTASQILNVNSGATAPQWTSLSALIDTLGTAAQGDVLYRGSSGWVFLAPGTSGQFLQTQGAGANPQWAAASGSSLISTFLLSGATGTANLFAGPNAGNTTMGSSGTSNGCSNVLVGTGSIGQSITSGNTNTVLGAVSGGALTTGYSNTLLGAACGNAINTGYQNTLVGNASGSALTSGYQNTVVGYNSGTGITIGAANVIVGTGSGNAITANYGITILGEGSGTAATGSTNTIVGYSTGGGLTSGSGNTIVGYGLGSLSNPSNTLILGAGGVQLLVADGTTVRPQKPLKAPSYTVSGLPSASTAGASARAWVTDSTVAAAANFGATVAGGGSYGVPVYSDGTNWIIG
jgi:hypothetical protein